MPLPSDPNLNAELADLASRLDAWGGAAQRKPAELAGRIFAASVSELAGAGAPPSISIATHLARSRRPLRRLAMAASLALVAGAAVVGTWVSARPGFSTVTAGTIDDRIAQASPSEPLLIELVAGDRGDALSASSDETMMSLLRTRGTSFDDLSAELDALLGGS